MSTYSPFWLQLNNEIHHPIRTPMGIFAQKEKNLATPLAYSQLSFHYLELPAFHINNSTHQAIFDKQFESKS